MTRDTPRDEAPHTGFQTRRAPMSVKLTALLLGALVSMGPSSSSAGDAEVPPEGTLLKTKLIVASLFKNGLGFMGREGALPRGDVTGLVESRPGPGHRTLGAH